MLLTTTALLAACSDSATAPNTSLETELEDVVFDVSASPNDVAAAVDRRTPPGRRGPERKPLTEEQRKCVADAIEAFREANKATLEQLKEIHQKAREAYAAGASREEVARILQTAQPLLERLREAHQALHEKIRACLAS
jgi:hypothetical protein